MGDEGEREGYLRRCTGDNLEVCGGQDATRCPSPCTRCKALCEEHTHIHTRYSLQPKVTMGV